MVQILYLFPGWNKKSEKSVWKHCISKTLQCVCTLPWEIPLNLPTSRKSSSSHELGVNGVGKYSQIIQTGFYTNREYAKQIEKASLYFFSVSGKLSLDVKLHAVINTISLDVENWKKNHPHSTEIFRKYCSDIRWKYCKINEIFWNLSLILLKCCNNLAMFAQNMTYAIFSKDWQN